MPEATYLTEEGAAKLRAELEDLKGPKRQALAERLRSAIQMGDLSENADYHKAKEDQAFLEGRILEVDYVLRNATIINKNPANDVVNVGSHVTIQEGDAEPELYHIVGAKEADPRNGKISNESPIGRALVNRKLGEIVAVETPGGSVQFRIVKIE
jgi:transcription elongation factor GreA